MTSSRTTASGSFSIRDGGSASHAPESLADLASAAPGTGMVFPGVPGVRSEGDSVGFRDQSHPDSCLDHSVKDPSGPVLSPCGKVLSDFVGCRFLDLGPRIQQLLQEVLPLRSEPMGKRNDTTLFPLPTSRSILSESFPLLSPSEIFWMSNICIGLNSLWGEPLSFEGSVTGVVFDCLCHLVSDIKRISAWTGKIESFDWDAFFSTRSIDYKGDEVKTAREFTWNNIAPALPKEIGRVPLAEVCSLGAKHYVENFDAYLRPPERWELKRPPRVMVPDDAWGEVCRGLTDCGICTFMKEEDLFHTGNTPLLNGLFGVTKDEFHQGHEVYRLIMNLVPLNGIVESLKGDVETLPTWSMTTPFQLQPDESLVVSSEDVRCFFYVMGVPQAWWKYLGFNKRVPDECLPLDLRGHSVFLAAKVLPMGFANSVSLAQHVHRNLALWSGAAQDGEDETVNLPQAEIRKDRAATVATPAWRIYLDNYDLLERVKSVDLSCLEGQHAPAALALRQQYEYWEVPRNLKKSVSRSPLAEVQGAQVDGRLGVAYPREAKLLKYMAATMSLLALPKVTQRQVQVVCGGLVYVSMFRRQLLGSLNAVWGFITSFDERRAHTLVMPPNCKLELVRFLSLLPLARLDFRMPYVEQVTCSDASTQGGGVCASVSLSRAGVQAAYGKLRGELPELRQEHQVLTVGLFDGIGALRVAADLLGLQVLGHISVEISAQARRVVESHFPEVHHCEDVALIGEEMVKGWARLYSQASLVVIGAGPPCQGVSGLNADRKGALRDERSVLFKHVRRVWALVQKTFCWCQVHCLMESVASMDAKDRAIMSDDFGEDPWQCDAGTLTWCHRPRLYWMSWELTLQAGVDFVSPEGDSPRQVVLTAFQDMEDVCKEGWVKVDPSRSFPTFTTSRPRNRPGHKPAGIKSCTAQDIARWVNDRHRFPPYQYTTKNLVINKHDEVRLPDIEEKEFMMGFPVGYTQPCVPKASKGTQEHQDVRHSLIGNSWCVPVVAWLLGQLWCVRNLDMPKRVLEAPTQATRAQQRQRLGSLKDLTVQPATKQRYNRAIDGFLAFLRQNSVELPRQRHLLDPLVCEYLEYLWSSGHGRAMASDTVAGLQDNDIRLKGHLQGAWRLLKTWAQNEIPARAPPLPAHVLHAMVGWSFFHQHVTFGVSLLLGYYGMLRTGEILSLRSSHVLCERNQQTLVVSLGLTKGGKRQGAAESVVIGYDLVVKVVQQWKRLAKPTTPFAKNAAHWRAFFNEALSALDLQQHAFRPYSLRRGGLYATRLLGAFHCPKKARDAVVEAFSQEFVGPFLGAAAATLAHHGFIPLPVKEGEPRTPTPSTVEKDGKEEVLDYTHMQMAPPWAPAWRICKGVRFLFDFHRLSLEEVSLWHCLANKLK
eukprot:s1098_g20.t1